MNSSFTPRPILALVVCITIAAKAHAVSIPLASKVGPAPSGSGNGLNGSFWDVSLAVSTDAEADAVIAGRPPTATFVSTVIDYPSGPVNVTGTIGNTTLRDFLGVDAPSLNIAGAPSFFNSALLFTGYLKVTSAGSIPFALNSDDGSRLKIGGVTVVDNPFFHGPTDVAGIAEFSEPGLYPVEVLFYEAGGARNWSGIGIVRSLLPLHSLTLAPSCRKQISSARTPRRVCRISDKLSPNSRLVSSLWPWWGLGPVDEGAGRPLNRPSHT